MKPSHRKLLIEYFAARIDTIAPDFSPAPKKIASKSGFLLARKGGRMSTFIHLQPHDRKEMFTLEIAGSKNGLFPWSLLSDEVAWNGYGIPSDVEAAPPASKFRLRLPMLWTPPQDHWWPVSSYKEPDPGDNAGWDEYVFNDAIEDAIRPDCLQESVNAAVSEIAKYGLPYMNACQFGAVKH